VAWKSIGIDTSMGEEALEIDLDLASRANEEIVYTISGSPESTA
jgi:hypothetical protein